jgi:DNA-binding winged helix-turn-helix (wHTH) protein
MGVLMDTAQDSVAIIDFGRFTVVPSRREVLVEGQPIKLGAAFDMLMVLVEAQGEVVSKDALIRRVWAGTVVDENNLQRQIAVPRKALAAAVQLRSEETKGAMAPTSSRPATGFDWTNLPSQHPR